MLKYDLLGQTITFQDSAERYYDLYYASGSACLEASQRFAAWYKENGNIQTALDNYLPFVDSVIEELAFRPLFGQLAACEIYDMSEESYCERCVHLEHAESSLETVEQQYNAILKKQNAEKEYRADRKAGRSRWQGGGFGLGGALKGAAQAATLNAASGLGHGIFNAIGNAGSAISASMDKSALYKNSATQDTLLHGIRVDLCSTYSAHIDFINGRKGTYIQSVFDEDKASALFENAKKLPEKRNELLLQAFMLCPWNSTLVQYLFLNFPEDRKEIHAAAQRFSVDLSSTVEEILAQEYDETAQSSEASAQAAKKSILSKMQEYGISESPTLDRLETDCLRRLCKGYQTAGEATCEQLIEKVRCYPAQEKLKGSFLEELQKRIEGVWLEELEQICQGLETASEDFCNLCIEKVMCHKAPEDMKAPFLQRIHTRIQAIWTKELDRICKGLEAADEASCEQRKDAIRQHKAPENLKTAYFRKIDKRIQTIWTEELERICEGLDTADENTCEAILAATKQHKAPDQLKAPFLQKIQARIEKIWSAEDGEIFDNLYMKTDITNPQAVAETIAYVQSKGRTSSSQRYLDALNACTPKNINNARLYQNTNRYKLYIALAILSILGCYLGEFYESFYAIWVLAIPFFLQARKLKKAWRLLTINGAMIHPALLVAPSRPKSKK